MDVGSNYDQHRVLLIGQNQGTPKSLGNLDRSYMAALRSLRYKPTQANYLNLVKVLTAPIRQCPVHGSYIPLEHCSREPNSAATSVGFKSGRLREVAVSVMA